MKNLQKISSSLSPLRLLRFGLGMSFLYRGLAMIQNPTEWTNIIPSWTLTFFGGNIFLYLMGALCIFLALGFFTGILLKWISLAGALYLTLLLIFVGMNESNFRDFGLMTASLATYFLAKE